MHIAVLWHQGRSRSEDSRPGRHRNSVEEVSIPKHAKCLGIRKTSAYRVESPSVHVEHKDAGNNSPAITTFLEDWHNGSLAIVPGRLCAARPISRGYHAGRCQETVGHDFPKGPMVGVGDADVGGAPGTSVIDSDSIAAHAPPGTML